MARWRGGWIAAGLLAGLAGCGRLGVPAVGFSPGPLPGLEDRVWLDTGADAAPGTIRVFLSDGTLVTTSCGETYRLSPWRRVDDTVVAWEEDGVSLRAEILLLGPEALSLVIDPEGLNLTRDHVRSRAPVVCGG